MDSATKLSRFLIEISHSLDISLDVRTLPNCQANACLLTNEHFTEGRLVLAIKQGCAGTSSDLGGASSYDHHH